MTSTFAVPTCFYAEGVMYRSSGLRGSASYPGGLATPKSFSLVVDAAPIYRGRIDNERLFYFVALPRVRSPSLANPGLRYITPSA